MTIDDVVMKLNKKSLFCLKPSVRFFFVQKSQHQQKNGLPVFKINEINIML